MESKTKLILALNDDEFHAVWDALTQYVENSAQAIDEIEDEGNPSPNEKVQIRRVKAGAALASKLAEVFVEQTS